MYKTLKTTYLRLVFIINISLLFLNIYNVPLTVAIVALTDNSTFTLSDPVHSVMTDSLCDQSGAPLRMVGDFY